MMNDLETQEATLQGTLAEMKIQVDNHRPAHVKSFQFAPMVRVPICSCFTLLDDSGRQEDVLARHK